MSWLTNRRSCNTYICPEHKYVAKSNAEYWHEYIEFDKGKINASNSFLCVDCQKPLINMGTRWRAPKKRNDKAWKQISAGNIWWNKKVIKAHSEHANDHITKYFNKQMSER